MNKKYSIEIENYSRKISCLDPEKKNAVLKEKKIWKSRLRNQPAMLCHSSGCPWVCSLQTGMSRWPGERCPFWSHAYQNVVKASCLVWEPLYVRLWNTSTESKREATHSGKRILEMSNQNMDLKPEINPYMTCTDIVTFFWCKKKLSF